MDTTFWLPLAVVLSSMGPGLLIFTLDEDQKFARTVLNIGGAVLKIALIGVMLRGVYLGREYETRLALIPGFDFVLDGSALPMFFVSLSGVLWLITTIYAIGYLDLESSWHRSRFFGFFSICVSATTGIALAGNFFTFIIFYELLTLATYPLVVHEGTPEAMWAGKIYLAYTLVGGAMLLVGAVWLHAVVGPFDFQEGGVLAAFDDDHRAVFVPIFLLLVTGLGVKAALVPLHSWLPISMVAPAPVSALLHAVAVVKAGAYGIIRVVYDVFGVHYVADLGLGHVLVVVATVTIIYGSLQALSQDVLKRRLAFSTVSQVSYIVLGVGLLGPIAGSLQALSQDVLKRRLAFSTVSQVSYIVLGVGLLGPIAAVGGIVHLVHQGLMKITLFFCAGNIAETLGIRRISDLAGVAGRMPWTMAAFAIASLGMIGVPPLAGFISKWYLGMGAVEVGQFWVLGVLMLSSGLNAAYFLPILYTAYFEDRPQSWPHDEPDGRLETRPTLLWSTLATAALVVMVGVFAAAPVSPVEWVEIVIARIYPTPTP